MLSCLLFSACTNIKTIDRPVCTQINPSKGGCTYLISDIDFFVSDEELYEGKTWFELKQEMILVPISTWSEIKKYLLKNCKLNLKRVNCKKLEAEVNRVESSLSAFSADTQL